MTTKTETRLWVLEHGAGYEIPELIDHLVIAGTLVDTSWHNDISPSFILTAQADVDGETPRVWIEHVDPAQREAGVKAVRYCVSTAGETDDFAYEGNDLVEALTVLFRVSPVVGVTRG